MANQNELVPPKISKKFLLVLVLLFLITILFYLSFGKGLDLLLDPGLSDRLQKATDKITNPEQKGSGQNSGNITQEIVAEKPDWWFTYGMPSCYNPATAPIPDLGSVRIHWMKLESGETVTGSLLANDPTISFKGFLSGRSLELEDREHMKKDVLEPIEISGKFDENFEEFWGAYQMKLKNPPEGCSSGAFLTGQVLGKPCKNIDGHGCP